MSDDVVIRVDNVSKYYKLYDRPLDRLKESLNPWGRKYHRDFAALLNISFEIRSGETVGILGKNGSGKSTLLKIITGIVTPSTGSVQINGKVAALLELGAGFNPEFTGIENIYMNGTVMGFSRAEMDARLDDIVAFADIGDFIRQPVKLYSSGMFARLAFSVNANVNPDILIVDEALAVGDMFFQAKCIDRMRRMIDDGVTILFVSHDSGSVKSLCNRGILLNQGNLLLDSSADAVVDEYFKVKVQSEQPVLHNKSSPNATMPPTPKHEGFFGDNQLFLERAQYQRIQNGKAEFYNIQLLDETETEVAQIEYEQTVILRMSILIHEDIAELGYGYHLRSSSGVDVVYADSVLDDSVFRKVKKGDKYIVDWKFKACLQQGLYNITCVMAIPIEPSVAQVDFCDFIPCAVQFEVFPNKLKPLYGYVHWDNEVDVKKQ